jgi:hypothetical protein
MYVFLDVIVQVSRNCQVSSEQTSDSSAFLNTTCLLKCSQLWMGLIISLVWNHEDCLVYYTAEITQTASAVPSITVWSEAVSYGASWVNELWVSWGTNGAHFSVLILLAEGDISQLSCYRAVTMQIGTQLRMYRLFQKEYYNGIPNVTVWRAVRKRLRLKTSKNYPQCRRFRYTRHTVTFGIPLWSSFWNTPRYQWKPHWTVTIPGITRFVLLQYDSSNHCTCPLNRFIQALTL